jgi:FkbM family methyltransferase
MATGLTTRLRIAYARRVKRREQVRRAEFVQSAAEQTSHLAVEHDGALFFLPTRQKAGIDRLLKPEWKEKRHLQRALEALERAGAERPRSVFVDVGAHVGTTAITAVRRFGFESALAFEPETENFRLLRANLGVNGLESRIHTFNVAVSNRVGTARLKLRPAMGSKHRLLRADEPPPESAVTVPLTTLDRVVEEGTLRADRAGLLWLDVEGHELETLEGASRLRAEAVPIVMEFIPRGLRRDGRLGTLGSVLSEHYSHVVDLRRRFHPDPGLVPLDRLEQLAERYEQSFTDLLVFRRAA